MKTAREEAIKCAKRGWKVFPIWGFVNGQCECLQDCDSPCKHPRYVKGELEHGLKDATGDEAKINSWFDRWPNTNYAIVTGAISGMFVIDIDPPDGETSFKKLETTHGALGETLQVITPRGGRHLFFRHPGGIIKNSKDELGKNIDVRGDGGYVVGPGSVGISNNAYHLGEDVN